MRTTSFGAAMLIVALAALSCASGGDVTSRMTFYHGQTIPDEFFKVTSWTPQDITFEIAVNFRVIHMYHILLDESGKPVAEGWYSTAKVGRAYTADMKVKPGKTLEAGKKYRLCVGAESPEKVYITTNNYPCMSDYEFTLK